MVAIITGESSLGPETDGALQSLLRVLPDKLGGECTLKRVDPGAHLPTPWRFEPAKRPDNGPDYCLWTAVSAKSSKLVKYMHLYLKPDFQDY